MSKVLITFHGINEWMHAAIHAMHKVLAVEMQKVDQKGQAPFATSTRAVKDIAPSADWRYMAHEVAIR